MRFQGLDLNLLAAFDVLVEYRNVSRAAQAMNLSQSAMSNALARLRHFFEDELLISNGRGMALTPKAEELAPAIRATLLGVQSTITSQATFDPRTSNRLFSIVASDYVQTVLLNTLLQDINREAPGLRFRILPISEVAMEHFALGKVDVAVLAQIVLLPNQPSKLVFEDTFVAICSEHNRDIGDEVSLEQIRELGHAAVSLGTERPGTIIDLMLRDRGIDRRVEVDVPTFSSLPGAIVGTSRIAMLHKRLATYFADILPIRMARLPLTLPPVRLFAQWHKLRERDGGLEWLLQKMHTHCESIDAGKLDGHP